MTDRIPPTEEELDNWEVGLSEADYEPGTLGDNIERCIREIRRLRAICAEAAVDLEEWNKKLSARLSKAAKGEV
jgi:hypothetical protein